MKPLASVAALLADYKNGKRQPEDVIHQAAAVARQDTHAAWIQVLSDAELAPYLATIKGHSPDTLPLFGIPFAIKDNIDLAGIPTTAACPDFCHVPERSATVVERLIAAGAIPIGKTNLDQFATGLVGVRSPDPWGPCKNALNPDYISGGSSSGSAVSVALGQVAFALGTDTAGSGRIPAAFNRLVGLKPTRGLLSTRGVVPACASLDCVTVFAQSCADANRVLDVVAVHDAEDPWSRSNPYANGKRYFRPSAGPFRFGVPRAGQLEFFGDGDSQTAFAQTLEVMQSAGGEPVELDFSPLLEAAKLLYQGPWVTERYLATRDLLESKPDALLPVTRQIIEPGGQLTALETFETFYQLQAYRQALQPLLQAVDVLVTPTAGTCYRIEEVLADPVRLNSNLGYYTNFMNLLDLAALALPTATLPNGVGFGVTLFHRAFSDKLLLSLAARLEGLFGIPAGVRDSAEPAPESATARPSARIPVVVCGAHLQGLPLNWQLTERGGTFVERTRSARGYRLYALAGGPPMRPGMVRDASSNADIEIEVWQVPQEAFGSFVAEIPAPLGIGKVELADGRWLPGFICEGSGLEGATEITQHGGWRNWLASRKGS